MGDAADRQLAWTVVVPVKGGPAAKSRLSGALGRDRRALSHALALDTLDAARAARDVARLVVVTSDHAVADAALAWGADVVPDPGTGLNAAVEAGVAAATSLAPHHGIAVLLGDLPALRPADLTSALAACAEHERAVVPDRQGTGTVLLTARPPVRLRAAFGAGSAARHARDATRLDLDLPRLRADVDDAEGLALASALALGARTAAIVAAGAPTPAATDDPPRSAAGTATGRATRTEHSATGQPMQG